MSKELQAEIRECIVEHADELACHLAELFKESTVKRFARALEEVEQEAKPSRSRAKKLPREKAPKRKLPAVARAKKRTRRAKPKPAVAQRLKKKKSCAEVGEDIVGFIRKNPGCAAGDVMKGLGIRQSTWALAKRSVQSAGRIRKQGDDGQARYFVTDTVVRRSAA